MAVISMRGNFGPAVMQGVFACPASERWGIQLVRSMEEFTPTAIKCALEHRTDGFILAAGEDASADAYAILAASRVPFAAVETYASALDVCENNAVHVRIDNAAVGRDAAASFVAQGRYASFAFVPPRQPREWSRRREKGFRDVLDKRKLFCETFPEPPCEDAVSDRGYLAKWLRHLPKPAAVMAADDSRAYDVLLACRAAHIVVPNEVSVIGVDDETLICEHAVPPLSSLRPDFEKAGYLAAEHLDALMRRTAKPKKSAIVIANGLNEIVRRGSTVMESFSGPLVQKALAFIARNAVRGIGVKDVVVYLGVSRSLADLRFRQVHGTSILESILDVRIAELKRLLAQTDDPIESITSRLGWKSPNYPKNLFKKRFGVSMINYRKRERVVGV